MRRASISSVMRMRSTSARQRGGTGVRGLASLVEAVLRIGQMVFLPQPLPRSFSTKHEFHEHGAAVGVVVVRCDTLEAERFVKGNCLLHGAERVEPHPLVPYLASRSDDGAREFATQTLAAEGWPEVEPVQLADPVVNFPQRDT